MNEFPIILTLEQAAEMLQLSTRTIQRLVSKGGMPGRRIGGQWRFDRDQLREWVRGADVSPPAEPLSQLELIEQEAKRIGADLPQTLIDLQQAAKRRRSADESGEK
jgi:PTS system nitrogen regulatory IIA component